MHEHLSCSCYYPECFILIHLILLTAIKYVQLNCPYLKIKRVGKLAQNCFAKTSRPDVLKLGLLTAMHLGSENNSRFIFTFSMTVTST